MVSLFNIIKNCFHNNFLNNYIFKHHKLLNILLKINNFHFYNKLNFYIKASQKKLIKRKLRKI